MNETIKSGKQILDDFFNGIEQLPNVDSGIAALLKSLYEQGKLTDTNIKNELQKLRDTHATN